MDRSKLYIGGIRRDVGGRSWSKSGGGKEVHAAELQGWAWAGERERGVRDGVLGTKKNIKLLIEKGNILGGHFMLSVSCQ